MFEHWPMWWRPSYGVQLSWGGDSGGIVQQRPLRWPCKTRCYEAAGQASQTSRSTDAPYTPPTGTQGGTVRLLWPWTY